MPKLYKVVEELKELKQNIGLATIVEFLGKKGFTVDNNPNARISDDQFDLLVKEFGSQPAPRKDIFDPLRKIKEREEARKTGAPRFVIPNIQPNIQPKVEPQLEEIASKGGKVVSPTDEKGIAETKPKIESEPKKTPSATAADHAAPAAPTAHAASVKEKPVKETVSKEKTATSKPSTPDALDKKADEKTAEKKPAASDKKPESAASDKKKETAEKKVAAEKPDAAVKPSAEQPAGQPTAEQPSAEKTSTEGQAAEKQLETPVITPSTDQKAEDGKKEDKEGAKTQGAKDKKPPRKSRKERRAEIREQREAIPPDVNNQELFRIHKLKPVQGLNVIGKIDIDEINPKTRPPKKSKEEIKREHEKRVQQRKTGQQAQQTRPRPQASTTASSTDDKSAESKPKRKRIQKNKIDIAAIQGSNYRRDDREREGGRDRSKQQRQKRPLRVEINEEDVQKQVKETLARLTSKPAKGKGAKYRRDKRDLAAQREMEAQEAEERESKVLKLTEFVTANDLANMMDIPVNKVITTCFSIGIMVSINQRLDAETINIVAEEFGFTTEYVSADVVEAITEEEDSKDDLVERPPIVTVMGHVDHGKTSLLDNIRKSNVIAGEAGGITQHIGAYNVKLPSSGRHITFLDTPGHEAFTAMRARGAKITDIAIIIVAADDSVMPQTVEAINHASAAGVPIVFAINKIDKPHANPEKIKEELANMNYLVEDWGGKYQCQEISAKQGIGVPELLEKVLLEADMLELKANPNRRATGSIIESSLDKGRGYVATVLVSNGTLHQGDIALAGTHYGRIRAMFNERNQRIEAAKPSEPAIILGLDGAPTAGDTFNVLESEQEAREIASKREQLQRELGLRTQKRYGLEELGRRKALGDFHELNLIVKGDVDGSVEALSDSLIKLSTEEVQVHVIHKAVGQISESDIALAATASAVVIGFQVRPSAQARKLADAEGVEIRLYSIIYDAINEVRDAMEGMLAPEIREDIIGEVEVLEVFKISKVGTIAGSIVKEGKIRRNNKVRVVRDGIVIHTGDLGSLKRFKDEVKEVFSGQDCGIYVNNFNDIQVGDIIEPFDQIEIKKTL
ncbi:MAG: translation initiation factor IF-2 [Tannerella sp.]|jgi:translation initiation factor IF-2|nr:translation initiation factor IF-2 [Tannerella sp.]